MRENTDQKNSEYGHLSRNEYFDNYVASFESMINFSHLLVGDSFVFFPARMILSFSLRLFFVSWF